MNAVGSHTSVLVSILFLVLSPSIKYVVSTQKQNSENLFPFLGYLQGFKLGQSFALDLPPFILSPIVIVPVMNQNQGLILEPNNNENYEKKDYHMRNISYSKLSSNFPVKPDVIQYDDEEKDDKIKQSNESDVPLEEKILAESDIATDTLRQAISDVSDNGTTEINEVLSTTSMAEFNNNNVENLTMNNATTKQPGPYPQALYNNEFLNNLTITMQQTEQNFTVSSTESNLQNFSVSTNVSNVVSSHINVTNNSSEFAIFSTTQTSKITNLYPYPNAISNSMADRLSITNPYLDEGNNLPPSYDDRWQSFSSLTKLYPNSGFRPLAGLYYDGFLHKSLNKKTGFIPFGGRNNDYEQ